MTERNNDLNANASTANNNSMDHDMPCTRNSNNSYYYLGDDTFDIHSQYDGINQLSIYRNTCANPYAKLTTQTATSIASNYGKCNVSYANVVYSFCIRSCNPLWTKDMIKERIERFERIGKVSSIDFVPRKNINKHHNKPYNMVFIHIKEWDPIQTQRINPKTDRYLYQDLIHRANSSRGLKIRAYYPTVSGTYHPYAYEYLVLRENKNPESRQEIVNRKDTTRIINSIKHNYEKKISELQSKLQQYEDDKDDFCFVDVTY